MSKKQNIPRPSTLIYLLILSLLFILTTSTVFAASQDTITKLSLNESHLLHAAKTPYDTSLKNRVNDLYYRSYAPYLSVYSFPVTPGMRYTLVTKFSGDKTYGNVEIVGINPLSTDTSLVAPSGTMSNYFGFSGSSNNTPAGFTYRNNFSISPESTGTTLYLLAYFESPDSSIEVTLQSPAIDDQVAEQSLENGMVWGSSNTIPIYTFSDSTANSPGAEALELVFTIGSYNALNNGTMETLDTAPYVKQSRTMVPLRYIGEKLGAQVTYDATLKQVTYKTESKVLILWLGKAEASIDGKITPLDSIPENINGRLTVPLRFISENLGAQASFDAATRSIRVYRK